MANPPPDLDRAELAGDYAASAGLYCGDCDPANANSLARPDTLAEALEVWAKHRAEVHLQSGRAR